MLKWIWKQQFFELQRLLLNVENTYIYGNVSWQWPKKDAFISKEKQLENQSLTFFLKNQLASFSYQHSVSFTHGSQHYCFLGQTGWHRPPGLWQMSRQTWTTFLAQKWLQLLGYQSKSVQERRENCRILTETNPFNGRSRFLPVYSTKESTSFCSRQFSLRAKFVAISSIYTVERHGVATEACSQDDWRCGSPKQKNLCYIAAIQGGQPRNFLYSSPSIRTEEGGRKISANCVCQL